MDINSLFKDIASGPRLDDHLTVTVKKKRPNGKCAVIVEGFGSLQGYSLTRFINSEYDRERSDPINYNIGDPTISGIASIIDDEQESVTIIIDRSELKKFKEFLVSRRDDIEFLFENAEITNYLRTQKWQDAKNSFQMQLSKT